MSQMSVVDLTVHKY